MRSPQGIRIGFEDRSLEREGPKGRFNEESWFQRFAVSKKDRKHCAVKLDASKGASSPRADEPLEKGDLVCGLLEGQTCVEPKKAGTLRRRESQQW
jgi:hypothetical protein